MALLRSGRRLSADKIGKSAFISAPFLAPWANPVFCQSTRVIVTNW